MKLVNNFTRETVGNKAYNLVELHEQGLNVPPFIIFEFDFFKEKRTKYYLQAKQKELETGSVSLRKLSDELRDWVNDQFLKEDKDDLLTYMESMTETDSFSVRSSATSEDSDGVSYAGQFETILNVKKSHMVNEVKQVLKSMYRESVLSYMRRQKQSLVNLRMNIIVQSMVVGDVSGVYFTANPKGLLNEHVVVIGRGLGSEVVEDKIPTTTITIHPDDDISYFETTEDSPVLTDYERMQLDKMAAIIEKHFGPAMDIEFTFEDSRLYVLQARPITTLPQGELLILDNSNIVESYPGVTTPLTYSFIHSSYKNIMRNLAIRLLGNDKKTLEHYDDVFDNMIASVNSRVYYQIQNWYQLLQLLPFSSRLISIWQDMLGVRNLDIPEMPVHVSFWQRGKIFVNAFKEFFQVPRNMEKLEDKFKMIQQVYYNSFTDAVDYTALWDLYTDLKASVMDYWDITLINDLYAFVYTGLLKKMTSDEQVQEAIAGIEQIESMKPAKAMQEIIMDLKLKENDELREEILNLEDEQVWHFLNDSKHPIVHDIQDFIAQYGDRAPEELKLETKTFRTHPELFIHLIQQLINNNSKLLTESQNESNPSVKTNKPLAKWIRKQAMLGIQNRESSRLNRTRLYAMARSIFITIGELLVSEGKLAEVEDVFFLTVEELYLVTKESDVLVNPDKLASRKQSLAVDKELPAYSRLLFIGETYSSYPQNIEYEAGVESISNIFNGIGSSAGKVIGEVLLVDDVQTVTADEAIGKIIVTKMTDPGWVYILAGAKGIIAEKGSLLSHTAIISRELGIPAVVNVKNATSELQTGDIIEIDGQTGKIQRQEQ